jgi:hypothetical protein
MAFWKRDWRTARVLFDSAAIRDLAQYVRDSAWVTVGFLQGRRGSLAARLGDTAAAQSLDRWLDSTSNSVRERFQRPLLIARAKIAATLGQRGRALYLLDKAMEIGWDASVSIDPDFEAIRGDPVFRRLTRPKG